jgi:hypothetical protein
VSRAWLKPFGDSTHNIRNDWTNEFFRDPAKPMQVMTGSENPGSVPKLRPGDRIILHGVGHRRVFAAGRVVSSAKQRTDSASKWRIDQWPWFYDCEIDVWVPLVSGGPLTWDLAPRVKGHISYGAPYSELRTAEVDLLVQALRRSTSAVFRPGSDDERARAARIDEIRKSGRRLALPDLDAGLERRPGKVSPRARRGRR